MPTSQTNNTMPSQSKVTGFFRQLFAKHNTEIASTQGNTPVANAVSPSPVAPTIPGINGGIQKAAALTYGQYGAQVCAAATGSNHVLPIYLQQAYNNSYNEQANNVNLQQQRTQQLVGQVSQLQITLKSYQQQIQKWTNDIETDKKEIKGYKDKITDLEESTYQTNKDAKTKLIIGLFILIPLSFYLLLFYSSTIFSAFFKDFSQSGGSLKESMFDASAISSSFSQSLFQGSFVMLAPFIFMGLGFLLHFYNEQKTWSKWLKSGSIVAITFAFDCILAYKIGSNLYHLDIIQGLLPLNSPDYSISYAVSDVNTWAVIFCGFIVYIIWGLVFDMAYTAYGELDDRKIQIKALNVKIDDAKNNINQTNINIQTRQNDCTDIQKEIASLQNQIQKGVIISIQQIKTDVNDFFAGWMQQMKILNATPGNMQDANQIYTKFVGLTFP